MYETNYHRATSVEEAAKLLANDGDAKILAGGHTLIPTMKQRLAAPTALVDIARIDALKGIRREGDSLVIGAATTHAEVAGSEIVKAAIPGLASLAGGIGDPAVRHRGTIGGSVANNDPAADYPSAVLALGASVITNTRTIAADDFFQGMFTTALEEGEIITAISFPVPKRSAYAKFPNPASRYAIAGVFVAETGGGYRVAVTGAGQDGVFRSSELEAAASSGSVSGVALDAGMMNADIHASAEYRAHLVMVMAGKALGALS